MRGKENTGPAPSAAWRPVTALLSVACVLAACTTNVSPSPSISVAPTTSPTPSPSFEPTPAEPTPSPTPPPPHQLSWQALGSIDVGGQDGNVSGMLALNAGYVAWGIFDHGNDVTAFAVWFSPDGAQWQQTLLADQVAPCPGWTPRSSLEGFYGGATNGDQVVLVGTVLDSPTRRRCEEIQPITLSTYDGVSWHRSGPSRRGGADYVWPVAGGWQSYSTGTGDLWASTDGLSWQRAGFLAPTTDLLVRMTGSMDGTLVATRGQQLVMSTDGQAWDAIRTFPLGWTGFQIAASSDMAMEWVVALHQIEPGRGRTLSSANLEDWHRAALPNPETAWLVPWQGGWLAFTYWQGRVVGCNPCPAPPPPAISWSLDGTAWTDLQAPSSVLIPFDYIAPANGPAGLLTTGWTDDAGVQVLRVVIE